MRDIVVTLVIFGLLPYAYKRPVIGIYIWAWLSYMNPHRLCWGFAQDLPFAQIVAIVTLLGWFASKDEPKRIPWTRESVILLLFILWMLVTTIYSFYPIMAWEQMDKIWKVQLMIFVTMTLINTKQRLIILVWVIAVSLGFYGVKGGIFTILNGGAYRVQGPMNTFIGGNNEMRWPSS
jgi:probable O-glycosylation ligase (exosortase A-associated)